MNGRNHDRRGSRGNIRRPHNSVWLALEISAGAVLVVTLAVRNNLSDYARVLPTAVVVALVGVIAVAFRRRLLFLLGASGAILGMLFYEPRLHVSFSPDADPADMALIWQRMEAEIHLHGAFVGALVAVAVGFGLKALKRSVWKEGRLQFTLRWLLPVTFVVAVLLSCWRWLATRN